MAAVIRALVTAAVGAALVVPAASLAATPHAKLSNCGRLEEHPAQLVLACADANYELAQLAWSSWGAASASAVGKVRANDCTPYCAAGHFHTYKAVLVASGRQVCHGVPSYAEVRISFPGKTPYPKAKPADLTYPRPCH